MTEDPWLKAAGWALLALATCLGCGEDGSAPGNRDDSDEGIDGGQSPAQGQNTDADADGPPPVSEADDESIQTSVEPEADASPDANTSVDAAAPALPDASPGQSASAQDAGIEDGGALGGQETNNGQASEDSGAPGDGGVPDDGNVPDGNVPMDAGSGITGGDASVDSPDGGTSEATCGDGVVDTSETCDPPGSEAAGGVCGADCQLPGLLSCEECTELNCEEQWTACVDPVNDGSLPAGQTGNRCVAAVECMQTPLPSGQYCTTLDGDQDTLSCVCPVGMDALTCAEQDPATLTDEQFACLPTLRRAAVPGSGAGDPPASMLTVLFNLVDPEMAIGDAMAVINCQIAACSSCEHIQPD